MLDLFKDPVGNHDLSTVCRVGNARRAIYGGAEVIHASRDRVGLTCRPSDVYAHPHSRTPLQHVALGIQRLGCSRMVEQLCRPGQLDQVARVARASGIEVSVCGEMAANPLGAFLLLGLDITALSVAWPSLTEIKNVIRQFRIEDARKAAKAAVSASTGKEVMKVLADELGKSVDLSVFAGRWNLSLPDKSRPL